MNKQKYLAFFAVVILVALTAFALFALKSREQLGKPGVMVGQGELQYPEGKTVITNRIELPEALPGYTSRLTEVSALELTALPADTTFGRRIYSATDGFESLVSVVLMGQDRSSIHTPQYCLTGQGWQIEKEEEATIRINQPHAYDLPVRKITLTRQVERNGRTFQINGIFVYWFVADQKLYGGQRLWNMAWDVLRTGVLDRWAYVINFATCEPGREDETFRRMSEFLGVSVPQFQLTAGQEIPSTLSSAEK